jgi:uncharacterized protein (TIGR02001 family)
MLTSIRGLLAATMLAGSLFAAAPALAQEEDSAVSVSANVALVTDYRFRGYSLTDGDPALQGGIDVALPAGFYVGTWASTISGGSAYGEMELDAYAGWGGEFGAITVDAGVLYYIYPTGDDEGGEFDDIDTDFFETYASLSAGIGPVTATVGAAYTFEQNAVGNGDEDNIYLYTDLAAGIPDTPISLTAHVGYNDGPFSYSKANGKVWDFGVGASYAVTESLSLGVNYADVGGENVEDFSDAGVFFTLGYSM